MHADLDIRLLRHFVVVAEELHFGRGARRLFVAQQALSRDIRRLEQRIGAPLLDRTTRRVALTAAGELLLVRARQLLALHDQTLRELRGHETPLLVDVVAQGHTPALVVAAARGRGCPTEFFARFLAGRDAALAALTAGGLDVTFVRWHGGRAGPPGSVLGRRLIRLEPIVLVVPVRHPLAALAEVPVTQLADGSVCWLAGDHVTPEWEDAARQLLGSQSMLAHPHVRGADELAHHVRSRDTPVLTLASQPAVEGAVIRPLVAPVPLYPWSMVWRREARQHPGLRALRDAGSALAGDQGWLRAPTGAWLPEPEASLPTLTD